MVRAADAVDEAPRIGRQRSPAAGVRTAPHSRGVVGRTAGLLVARERIDAHRAVGTAAPDLAAPHAAGSDSPWTAWMSSSTLSVVPMAAMPAWRTWL